ncbi:hypothetical protein M3Y98_00161500 [Aphelenchoides besseyi]|nr:hypothetical protein M3Y98_00161500 [Aphelenchoides besseyi]KAI6199913.1 hypothetical protein M3Y96_00677800 [Aphelenchoides besseyi]
MVDSSLDAELDLFEDDEYQHTNKNEFIDEDALLGLSSQNEKKDEPTTATQNISTAVEDEAEQLDYEEDEEEKKPHSKFESERKPQNEFKVDVNTQNEQSTTNAAGSKCFVNPKFRNRLQGPLLSGQKNGQLPSLLSCPVPPPGSMLMQPNVEMMARNVMMNSLRPLVPPNPMNRYGAPPIISQIPLMPPVIGANVPFATPFASGLGPPPPSIVQQDGTVTYRMTIPQPQPRVTIARAGMNSEPSGDDWSSMVDAFIKDQGPKKRRARSRSISTRSRSYSSSSYSDSYSGDSASESDRSFSRSPSPDRRRSRRESRRKYRSGASSRKRARDYSSRRSREDSRRSSRRRHSPRVDELKNTIECAEAIGLDQEYVKKLEQQKKEREEYQRRKHRQEDSASRNSKDTKKESRHSETSSSRHNTTSRRTERSQQSSQMSDSKSQSQNSNTANTKTRPYLAVVIHNLTTLNDAYKRVKMIASAVGPTKKVWQTDDDSVSVIFESHEHAKSFMLQYHMKPFNGINLNIGLEKVFLDLNSVP